VNPAFADRLKKMGVAQPNPIFSPSSTATPSFPDGFSPQRSSFSAPQFPPASTNVTLGALEARRQIQAKADKEFENLGRSGSQGREFLDVATLRNILVLRQHGVSTAEIESRLKLKQGVVARLGPSSVVSPAT